jgi:hypothetical protein
VTGRNKIDRMLGHGGFFSAHHILAITVSSWSDGYGYTRSSMATITRRRLSALWPAQRLELFARGFIEGWQNYGFEALQDNEEVA